MPQPLISQGFMPQIGSLVIATTIVGLLLVGGGVGLGYLLGTRRGQAKMRSMLSEGRLLRMVDELASWTSEYAGTVNRYQGQLDHLSQSVRQPAELPRDGLGHQLVAVLEEIMRSNRELQERLTIAERQLSEQTRQIESYLSEARTDALTGLANRRAFDRELESRFTNWSRGGSRFCLLLIDIDGFKQINDRFGHPAGDDVLRQVARVLEAELEGAYLVARFGGEEFAALMPPPLRQAAETADRARRKLTRERLMAEGPLLEVSISCGLSEPKDDRLIGSMVRRADEALYAAKALGRNRTYFHDGRQPVLVGAPEVNPSPS
jgi:diguanylate cyclase